MRHKINNIFGVATNDVTDISTRGCPYYQMWKAMIGRCYSPKSSQYRFYGAVGAVVEGEWLLRSGYNTWLAQSNFSKPYVVDKDLLIQGNKIYGPEKCCVVPQYINTMFNTAQKGTEILPIGVSRRTNTKDMKRDYERPYTARSNYNPSNDGNKIYASYHETPEEAHRAWQAIKLDSFIVYLKQYSKEACYRTDVKDAIILRIGKLENDLAKGLVTFVL